MQTYKLHSNPMVHAPGLIAWAKNGYAFDRDQESILRVVETAWAGIPVDALKELLSGAVPYTVEDETVVFTVEG